MTFKGLPVDTQPRFMTYPTETHNLSTGWDTVFPHHLIGHGGLHHIQNRILSKNASQLPQPPLAKLWPWPLLSERDF